MRFRKEVSALLKATEKQEANRDALNDELLDSKIRFNILKEEPFTFNAFLKMP